MANSPDTTPGLPSRFLIVSLILMGTLTTTFMAVFAWDSWQPTVHGVQVDGRVVGHKFHTGRAAGHVPIVLYIFNGREYRIEGRNAASSPKPAIGERITVLVNPSDPANAHIDAFAEQWLGPLIFGSIGGLMGLVGAGLLWYRIRCLRRFKS